MWMIFWEKALVLGLPHFPIQVCSLLHSLRSVPREAAVWGLYHLGLFGL